MLKKIFRLSNLKYAVAFLLPIVVVFLNVQWIDNDSWDVLAEGREIVQNGVYYTDKLSMHEDLEITVQNYGFAVLFYLVFSVLGASGIYVIMLALCVLVELLVYKIVMLISDKKKNVSLLVMSLTGVSLALMGFVATRAQMVSFVIFLAAIYILELFIKSGKVKFLFLLPFLAILQVNLHASLFWMLILVMFVYIIDSICVPKLHLQGYRTKPLVLALVGMLLCGLLNPYGFKMVSFIFTSYSNTRFHGMINELQPFSPLGSLRNAGFYLSIVFVIFTLIYGKKKNIRVRYLLMFFGFLALGLNTVKGLSQFILTMFLPAALIFRDIELKKVGLIKAIRVAGFWTGVIVLFGFVVLCPLIVSRIRNEPIEGLVLAMDVIDRNTLEEERSRLKVYAGYVDGAYVEYRGYKPYLDPRGEVFLKKNNGKEDILYEWDDLQKGKLDPAEFLEKYQFDYFLVSEGDLLYDYLAKDYETIFADDENGIKVFKRSEQLSILNNVSKLDKKKDDFWLL